MRCAFITNTNILNHNNPFNPIMKNFDISDYESSLGKMFTSSGSKDIGMRSFVIIAHLLGIFFSMLVFLSPLSKLMKISFKVWTSNGPLWDCYINECWPYIIYKKDNYTLCSSLTKLWAFKLFHRPILSPSYPAQSEKVFGQNQENV